VLHWPVQKREACGLGVAGRGPRVAETRFLGNALVGHSLERCDAGERTGLPKILQKDYFCIDGPSNLKICVDAAMERMNI
jgi:hypothetical protein